MIFHACLQCHQSWGHFLFCFLKLRQMVFSLLSNNYLARASDDLFCISTWLDKRQFRMTVPVLIWLKLGSWKCLDSLIFQIGIWSNQMLSSIRDSATDAFCALCEASTLVGRRDIESSEGSYPGHRTAPSRLKGQACWCSPLQLSMFI